MDFFETLYGAFEENWLLALSVLGIVVILRFPAVQLLSWWNDRKRRNVAQVNEWLAKPEGLSSEMRCHLYAERERWMLLSTRGISTGSLMLKVLINVSEDKSSDGITWEDLKLAQEYLKLEQNSKLTIHFKKGKWFAIIMLSIGIIFFLLLYFAFFLLSIAPVESPDTSNILSDLIGFALAFASLIPCYFFAFELRKMWVAHRIKERLESLQQ